MTPSFHLPFSIYHFPFISHFSINISGLLTILNKSSFFNQSSHWLLAIGHSLKTEKCKLIIERRRRV